MPLLLRDNASANSFGRTRRKSTSRGTLTPWRAPMLLIQLHRLLWMWAAIIPTVIRGMPGTCLDQTAGGSCSTRYVVARLFVRHAPVEVSLWLWAALHQRWMILLESVSELQFGRAFRHPQRGLMTIDKAIQLYAWHGLHHTAHITGFRAREGY